MQRAKKRSATRRTTEGLVVTNSREYNNADDRLSAIQPLDYSPHAIENVVECEFAKRRHKLHKSRRRDNHKVNAFISFLAISLIGFAIPDISLAASVSGDRLDLTTHWVGYAGLGIFTLAYLLVMAEEFTQLRKSKPVILASGIIWGLIAWVYHSHPELPPNMAEEAVRHNLLEYAELMLFLLVAMTYINAMDERNVFEALRSWLVRKQFGFRSLFWITGVMAFFISPVADNLTTALLMATVAMAVGGFTRWPKREELRCVQEMLEASREDLAPCFRMPTFARVLRGRRATASPEALAADGKAPEPFGRSDLDPARSGGPWSHR